jgi:hypothetical protein
MSIYVFLMVVQVFFFFFFLLVDSYGIEVTGLLHIYI